VIVYLLVLVELLTIAVSNFLFIIIQVGHDGTAPGTGWFVKSITIDIPVKGKNYLFSCGTWLARDKSDGKTERTFALDDGVSTITSYKPSMYSRCSLLVLPKYFLAGNFSRDASFNFSRRWESHSNDKI